MSTEKRTERATTSNETEQSHRDKADINQIMGRWVATRHLPSMERRAPMYGDFSDVRSFQASLDLVREMQQSFLELPSKVRTLFDNNPQKLLEFVQDPDNQEQAIELGLMEPPEEVETTPEEELRGGPEPTIKHEVEPASDGSE